MTKPKTARASTKPKPAGQDRRPIQNPANVDQAIQQAQHGRVNVTPERAIEMAGTLFSQGKYTQVEKVCRQVLTARPQNADAHNVLGVTLNAMGRAPEAIEALERAIELAPWGAALYVSEP